MLDFLAVGLGLTVAEGADADGRVPISAGENLDSEGVETRGRHDGCAGEERREREHGGLGRGRGVFAADGGK